MPEEVERECGARYVTFEEMLGQSDFISIHLPLNDSTRGMIDGAAFDRMRQGAILVNISRAHIVDRASLVAALDGGRIGGAGVDVHYDEPLKAYPNVILSPYIAVAARDHNMADADELITNLVDVLSVVG